MQRKTVVVTGAKDLSGYLAKSLRALGARTIILPTVELIPQKLSVGSKQALKSFADFDYVIFTSPHAVSFFVKALGTRGPRRSTASVIAVGPGTALTCKKHGFKPRVISNEFSAMGTAGALQITDGDTILFPRSAVAKNEAVTLLRERGAKVTVVHLYTAKDAKIPKTFGKEISPDFLVFMSGSSVRSFSKQVRGMLNVPAIIIGEQTAKACRAAGFSHIIIAEESTTAGIVKMLRKQL